MEPSHWNFVVLLEIIASVYICIILSHYLVECDQWKKDQEHISNCMLFITPDWKPNTWWDHWWKWVEWCCPWDVPPTLEQHQAAGSELHEPDPYPLCPRPAWGIRGHQWYENLLSDLHIHQPAEGSRRWVYYRWGSRFHDTVHLLYLIVLENIMYLSCPKKKLSFLHSHPFIILVRHNITFLSLVETTALGLCW